MDTKLIVVSASILIFGLLENLLPFFRYRRSLFKRIFTNFSLAVINTLATSVTITLLLKWARQQTNPQGLFVAIDSPWLMGLFTFLVLDCYIYWWHRLMHRWDFGWRFHRVHHTELEMNVSSAYRFHFLEVIASNLPKLPLVWLFGISPDYFLVYDLVFTAIVCFHHSNWSLPQPIDRALSYITVTPNFHRVHHSQIVAETNSNYSSVFSWWDRLFGTFKYRRHPDRIHLGLTEYPQPLNLLELLSLPFQSHKPLEDEKSRRSPASKIL